jgi:hypothetical protein
MEEDPDVLLQQMLEGEDLQLQKDLLRIAQ